MKYKVTPGNRKNYVQTGTMLCSFPGLRSRSWAFWLEPVSSEISDITPGAHSRRAIFCISNTL